MFKSPALLVLLEICFPDRNLQSSHFCWIESPQFLAAQPELLPWKGGIADAIIDIRNGMLNG